MPVMTYNRVESRRSQDEAALLVLDATGVPAVLAANAVTDGVVSPSVLDTLPRSVLATAHTWRMLLTNEGRFGVFRTAVWFVFSKLFRTRQ
jgi:hypothetical protein